MYRVDTVRIILLHKIISGNFTVIKKIMEKGIVSGQELMHLLFFRIWLLSTPYELLDLFMIGKDVLWNSLDPARKKEKIILSEIIAYIS